jgi:predicted nucleic-acid-binding Zn-ribbon protein
MRNGQCPKCNAHEVHLMDGPYELVSVPLSTFSKALMKSYFCVRCGYLELYVRDESDLPKIAKKWSRVRTEGG